jgi:hypothetical protein
MHRWQHPVPKPLLFQRLHGMFWSTFGLGMHDCFSVFGLFSAIWHGDAKPLFFSFSGMQR